MQTFYPFEVCQTEVDCSGPVTVTLIFDEDDSLERDTVFNVLATELDNNAVDYFSITIDLITRRALREARALELDDSGDDLESVTFEMKMEGYNEDGSSDGDDIDTVLAQDSEDAPEVGVQMCDDLGNCWWIWVIVGVVVVAVVVAVGVVVVKKNFEKKKAEKDDTSSESVEEDDSNEAEAEAMEDGSSPRAPVSATSGDSDSADPVVEKGKVELQEACPETRQMIEDMTSVVDRLHVDEEAVATEGF